MVFHVDLDPRMNDARIEPCEDLRPIPLQDAEHSTRMRTSLTVAENTMVSQELIKNADLFSQTASDMLGVGLDIITKHLSLYKEARPVAQKKRKMDEEKCNVARNETYKLVIARFIKKA